MDFGGRFADDFAWSPDSRYLAVDRSPQRRTGHLRRRGRHRQNNPHDQHGLRRKRRRLDAGREIPPLQLQPDRPQLPRIHRPVRPLPAFPPAAQARVRRGRFRQALRQRGAEGQARAKKDEKAAPDVVLKLEDIDRQTEIVVVHAGQRAGICFRPQGRNRPLRLGHGRPQPPVEDRASRRKSAAGSSRIRPIWTGVRRSSSTGKGRPSII